MPSRRRRSQTSAKSAFQKMWPRGSRPSWTTWPLAAGIAATVMTPDGTWSGASGTADGVHDMQPDSQFGIASGTKPIIAAQVMQLVEAGEVSLDAPATEYLPADFTFDTNGATIRQLLSHRSGIPDWYDEWSDHSRWTGVVSGSSTRSSRSLARLAVPSASFEYADTNYNLLGLVIEHVRQRPLVDVLRDGVLRVEGTERLIYQPDEAPTDPMAMPRGESRDALEQGGGYLPSHLGYDRRSCGRHGVRFDLARTLVAGVLRRRHRFGSLADRDVDVLRQRRGGVASRLRARAVQSRGAGPRRPWGTSVRTSATSRRPGA